MDMANYEGDDFHPSIEPMVIINSQDDEEENIHLKQDEIYNINNKSNSSFDSNNEEKVQRCIQPDITIFPVSQMARTSFKMRLFRKDSFSDDLKQIDSYDMKTKRKFSLSHKSPGIRTPVRLVSKDEALNAEETYTRRKSSPLEMCPICKKYFRRMKTHLLKHEVLQDGNEVNTFICELCSKAFNNQSNLQIHMRTHTGQKPYICEICTKCFSQSCNLVNHMRIHTGEKPFKCPHCDRAFTQSGNLNNHIRLHTDEKPFKCHFCDKAFVQSGNLNSHIRNNHRLKGFSQMSGEAMMT